MTAFAVPPPVRPAQPTRALARTLNDLLVPALRTRIADMGEMDSGAYNFYAVRAERGDLFAEYELALAERLIEAGLADSVHEIGGGLGTFSWLLAGAGASTICLEHDRRRFAAAQALWVPLAVAMPDLAARLELRKDSFPDPNLAPGRAVAVATNLVFTTTAAQRAAIIAALARYRLAIIDVDRFLDSTVAGARPLLLGEFAAAGLTGEPLLDLGPSACFWQFRQS